MARLGEQVLAFTYEGRTSGMVAISMREPAVGDKVVVMGADGGGSVAIKPFHAYAGDDGLGVPLPCGTGVSLVGEPPNYLPPSFESGVPMSCQQGQPRTNGWTCSSGCPINPSTHPTKAEKCPLAYGGPRTLTVPTSRIEEGKAHCDKTGSTWDSSRTTTYDYIRFTYGCEQDCGERTKCGAFNVKSYIILYPDNSFEGSTAPDACRSVKSRVMIGSGQMVGQKETFSCNRVGKVCQFYRGGAGTPFPTCGIKGANDKGPAYTPGQKPAGCKNHAHLSFDGWVIPGGEETVSTKRCDLTKATEGIRSNSDGGIVCKFFSPDGQIGQTVNSGEVRLPISPDTPNQYGKAGSILSAHATISIPGSISSDYTRYPTRQQKSGTACIFTIGRY